MSISFPRSCMGTNAVRQAALRYEVAESAGLLTCMGTNAVRQAARFGLPENEPCALGHGKGEAKPPESFAAKGEEAMWRLISDLWGWLSDNHRLKGIADRGTAWVGGFIGVGLQSAVIKAFSARGDRLCPITTPQ